MCRESFLSRKAVQRANERVKQVLRDANQDKKLAIQFFPDYGAPSVLEDMIASNTTLYAYILIVLLPRHLCTRTQTGHFMPRHRMLYGHVINLCGEFRQSKNYEPKNEILTISPNCRLNFPSIWYTPILHATTLLSRESGGLII